MIKLLIIYIYIYTYEKLTCFCNIGSKAGSRVSPMSSNNTGLPIRILLSNVLNRFASVRRRIRNPFLASIAFIHPLAWAYIHPTLSVLCHKFLVHVHTSTNGVPPCYVWIMIFSILPINGELLSYIVLKELNLNNSTFCLCDCFIALLHESQLTPYPYIKIVVSLDVMVP
jgi:hypothetical protein